MQATEHHQLFDRVRAHAFRQLSQSKLHTTNLYLDERVYSEGEVIEGVFSVARKRTK